MRIVTPFLSYPFLERLLKYINIKTNSIIYLVIVQNVLGQIHVDIFFFLFTISII